MTEMRQFIEYVAKNLVDYPEEVEVRQIDGEKTIIFELKVNKSDIGKIIGRGGRTIKASRARDTGITGQRVPEKILAFCNFKTARGVFFNSII